MKNRLLTPISQSSITLSNRIVMAPMNRRRADINGVPSKWMIPYYEQRATAGLIITDNVLIAPNAGEALNTPAIYNDAQITAWRKITGAVHAKGGKIFIQLVHGGRMGHPAIQKGLPLIAPSALKINETIAISTGIYEPMPTPVALTTQEIPNWIAAFRAAAENAVAAGFDGVEIHGAHGFLIDQFVNPHSNHRSDAYGGSIENRSRFLIEVVETVVNAIGKEKVGIRLSPFREIYGIRPYGEEGETHQYILDKLNQLGILYVHFSNAVVNGSFTISDEFLEEARGTFNNWIIMAGGLSIETGASLIQRGWVDLVAFGRMFISNPDLVKRIEKSRPFTAWDERTFYHGGAKGYIDYSFSQ